MQQKIVPNLWFNGTAHEAVQYYVEVIPNSRLDSIAYYPKTTAEGLADFQRDLAGKPLSIEFTLNGQAFTAINAGSEFTFNEAVSFAIYCKDQEEIDYYWEKLSSQSDAEQCGWCKDKFGLSWQIIPENMEELMKKPGAFAKMMRMHKIIIDEF